MVQGTASYLFCVDSDGHMGENALVDSGVRDVGKLFKSVEKVVNIGKESLVLDDFLLISISLLQLLRFPSL